MITSRTLMRTPLFPLLAILMLGVAQHPASAQQATWTSTTGAVRVVFPRGWKAADYGDTRVYAQRQGGPLPGSFHRRRAGGFLPPRHLTAAVRLISQQKQTDISVEDVARMLEQRTAATYAVVDRDYGTREGIALVAYRFMHTGSPVTQAVLVFADSGGRLYAMEVTGHRKDEELLLGEARQLMHSIELR